MSIIFQPKAAFEEIEVQREQSAAKKQSIFQNKAEMVKLQINDNFFTHLYFLYHLKYVSLIKHLPKS